MNNIKEIEKIYYELHVLSDDYKDLPEKEEADKKIYNYMRENNFFSDNEADRGKFLDVESLIVAAEAESERQGFIYGFQYAISLLIGNVANGNLHKN